MCRLIICILVLCSTAFGCQFPKKGQFICGTNGISFINLKALQCYNQENSNKVTRFAYLGRCIRPEVPECNYSFRAKHVCGSDGLTYLNPAMVKCKNTLEPKKRVKIMKKGSC